MQKQILLALAILCSTTAWSRPLGPDSVVAEILTRTEGPDNTFILLAQPVTWAQLQETRQQKIAALIQEWDGGNSVDSMIFVSKVLTGVVGAAWATVGIYDLYEEYRNPTEDPVARKSKLVSASALTGAGFGLLAILGNMNTTNN